LLLFFKKEVLPFGSAMPRLDTVDLRLLRVFATVVETRGFSAAQTVLNVSTSTISNQIGALESRLGVKLCQRGRAGFKLTEDGALIFSEAQKLFSAIDSFDLRASALRARIRGSLTIGLVDNTISDSQARIADLLRQFSVSMRDVQLSVEIKSPSEILRDLLDGRLHVAIGSFPKILLGLVYEKLYEEPHFFYCGRKNPLYRLDAAQVTIELISQQRVISRGYWGARDIKQFGSDRGSATVNNMEAGAHLILSGEYVGYLPAHYAQSWVETKDMKPLLPDELHYAAPFDLAYNQSALKLKPAKFFIEQVRASFEIPKPAD
jgi:DNA-binding transcriptional LysR family regulator